jgi:hypothetical protein
MFYGTKRRIDGRMCVVGVVLMHWQRAIGVCAQKKKILARFDYCYGIHLCPLSV